MNRKININPSPKEGRNNEESSFLNLTEGGKFIEEMCLNIQLQSSRELGQKKLRVDPDLAPNIVSQDVVEVSLSFDPLQGYTYRDSEQSRLSKQAPKQPKKEVNKNSNWPDPYNPLNIWIF